MALIVLVLFGIAVSLSSASASHDQVECTTPPRLTVPFESGGIYLDSHPYPLSGSLPDINGMAGVSYDIARLSDAKVTGQVGPIGISSGAFLEPAHFQEPTSIQRDSVLVFFEALSQCMSEGMSLSVANMVSDWGMGWLLTPDDPFLTTDTPLAFATRYGSLSRSVGAFPLEIYHWEVLDDGRIAVVTGDGSIENRDPRGLFNPPECALWILHANEDTWKIDAIVGGFWATSDYWIDVPVG